MKNALTHGGTANSKTERLYNIWAGMRWRCRSARDKEVRSYASRGITVCPEWDGDYAAFRAWALANGYNETLTLERRDNEKGYNPNNCTWATAQEQARNRRGVRLLTALGRTMILSDWAKELGVRSDIIRIRIDRGWTVEAAVTTPGRGPGRRE